MTTDYAKGVAVKTLNSGPAAGVIAARRGRGLGGPLNVVGFDMGGTSADIAVVRDGEPQIDALVRPRVGHADPLPEHRRRLDRRRRRLDRLARPGRLAAQRPAERRRRSRARPATARAARSRPTPTPSSCSGASSNDLFLERPHAARRRALGRGAAARASPSRSASAVEDAAEGVLEIANANMVKAIRLVTVERGFDPRDFGARRLRRRGPAARRRPRARAADARGDRAAVPGRDERHGPALRRSARRLLVGVRRAARTRSTSPTSARIYAEMEERVVGNLDAPGRRARRDRGRARASTSATSASSHSVTVPLPEVTRAGLRQRPSRASTTSTCASTATRTPSSPVETSTLRVAARGRARQARPRLRSARRADPARGARRRASGRSTSTDRGWVDDAGPRPCRPHAPVTRSTAPASSRSSTRTVVLPPGTQRRGRRRRQHHHHAPPRAGLAMSDRDIAAGADRPDHVRGPAQRLHEHRRRDGADARARRPLARRQRGPRLQRRDLRRRRPHDRGGQGRPARRTSARCRSPSRASSSGSARKRLHEGDIFIMNDAFIGGTHCQDVRTIMPVFRDGELIAFVQNSAHWSDAGGPVPGTLPRRGAPRPTARRSTSRRSTSCARASSTTRSCASSCATCACPTRRRATCSRRSPPAAPARRACRA